MLSGTATVPFPPAWVAGAESAKPRWHIPDRGILPRPPLHARNGTEGVPDSAG